ncbi:MAG: heterodisulfide reductase-related iron-sulfur binding cluster [Candidatus Nezhaarchaeales archaeon]
MRGKDKGGVILYPGCVSLNKYPGIVRSAIEVLKFLGVEFRFPTNMLCCSRPLERIGVLKEEYTNALAYFNLTRLMDNPSSVIVVCNGCYLSFRRALEVNELRSSYGVEAECSHIAEVIWRNRHELASQAKVKLNKLRVAVHVGCHYLYYPHGDIIRSEDGEDILEDIALTLNAEVVDYGEKRTCCGGTMVKWFRNVTFAIAREKLKSIVESDANVILTMCPYCLRTFNRAQQRLRGLKEIERVIPVIHVSQLVALALGFDPVKIAGLHMQMPNQELERLCQALTS